MSSMMSDAETTPETNQAVVFHLGASEYCLDISYVDEIVERGELTPLPNPDPHLDGVMDLRGQTTTIFNPGSYFDLDEAVSGERIIILDREETNMGWIVDGVERVIDYSDSDIESSMSDGAVEGVIRRDEGFIILVDPMDVSSIE